jgi:4-amino-4-deoxy-L-arabinose transferase-like glycosyltransferase
MSDRRGKIALSIIIVTSAALSLYWVFTVPIFQAPDEYVHFDYAMDIYSAGRLINGREPLADWNAPPRGLHVFTQYLIRECDSDSMAFNPQSKAPPGYGTKAFYDNLDLNAPPENSGGLGSHPRTGFSFIALYPSGYWAVIAAWMKLLHIFSTRITVLFFGARIFSVILLVLSLILIYITLRELRLGSARALLFTAVVGLFPTTTFISSYIQADNLGLTLVMLSCYLALRLRRNPDNRRLLLFLGIALGMLCFTKYHYFLATFLAIIPMLIADQLAGRRKTIGWTRLFGFILTPVLAVVCLQIWISYGFNDTTVVSNPSTIHDEILRAAANGKWAVVSFLMDSAALAFSNFYLNGSLPLNGSTFQTFWGLFGWNDNPLVIMTPWKTEVIHDIIALLNVVVFALVILRLQQVITRLVLVARQGRWRRALCIAFSNPVLNAYFLYTLLMFGLFMVVRRSFAPQGRNWFPFMLPILMVGAEYASKALHHRLARRAFSHFILACLLLYCIVGSYYGIRAINNRYYSPVVSNGCPARTSRKGARSLHNTNARNGLQFT